VTDLKLVVLDCDGVMFDSREANRAYYGHLRERFDRPPLSEEEVAFVHSHPAPESVRFIFRAWPQDLAAVDAYRATVDYAPFLRQMAIEPDLLEFLAAVPPAADRDQHESHLDDGGRARHLRAAPTSTSWSRRSTSRRPKPHPRRCSRSSPLRRAGGRGYSSATPGRRRARRGGRDAADRVPAARISRPRFTSELRAMIVAAAAAPRFTARDRLLTPCTVPLPRVGAARPRSGDGS
jgi:hypothetical protein